VVPDVVKELDIGRHEPGRAFSAATHAWLGELSLRRGPLTPEALRQTGPLEWERAAYSVWRDRGASPTSLERGAAFLAVVNNNAVTIGTPDDRWARMAAEDAYPKSSLDLATALVLMDVLPPHLPFAPALALALEGTRPSTETVAALSRLADRGERVTPAAYDAVFEPHVQWAQRGDGGQGLVRDKDELIPVIQAAVALGAPPSAMHEVTEAMLRIDVTALPLKGLASRVSDPAMPWEEGWALLRERVSDPTSRAELAAHLICRGARVGVFPKDDHAAAWLTSAGSSRLLRVESAALELLGDAADVDSVVHEVERLTDEAPRKPPSAGPRTGEQEAHWRQEAVFMARRLAANASRGNRSGGRLLGGLAGSPRARRPTDR
jgi:hypothetical protein